MISLLGLLLACAPDPPAPPIETVGRPFWRIDDEHYHSGGGAVLVAAPAGRVALSAQAIFGPQGGLEEAWTRARLEEHIHMAGVSSMDGADSLGMAPRPLLHLPPTPSGMPGALIAMRVDAGPTLDFASPPAPGATVWLAAALGAERSLLLRPGALREGSDGALIFTPAEPLPTIDGALGGALIDAEGALVGLLTETTPLLQAWPAAALQATLAEATPLHGSP